MRSAPSARHPVGRSRFFGLLLLIAWSAGLAALLSWTALGPPPGWRHVLTGLVLLGCAGYGWSAWRNMPEGELSWDGAAWHWHGLSGQWPVAVEAVLDLQAVLLVRIDRDDGPAPHRRWLWLEQEADTTGWQAMRRAVYFHAGRQAQSQAAPANS